MDDMTTFSSMNTIPPVFGKARVIKNLIVMSLSLMLVFTAYDGLSMLQSTMNKEQNIGTISQAVVYITFCVSSLTLPKYAIKKLGFKIIYLIATIIFIPYLAANFYPCWATMMPSAMLLGVGSSMIWAAQAGYFKACVVLYCNVSESVSKKKNNIATICDGPLEEKLSNKRLNYVHERVISGDNFDFPCVHSENNSEDRCAEVSNKNSKYSREEIPSKDIYDCPCVLSKKSSKYISIDVRNGNSNNKTAEVLRNNSDFCSVYVQSEKNCKCLSVLSNERSNTTCAEVYSSEKNSLCLNSDNLSDENCNPSTVEIHSDHCYSYLSNDKPSVINSYANNSLKAHTTMNPNHFGGGNFESTENLLANDFSDTRADIFITINSEQQRKEALSVAKPNYIDSDHNTRNSNSQRCLASSPFASKVASNHISEHLNHGNTKSPFVINTFKGEITSDICDARSRCLNKHKLTVGITSDIEEDHHQPKSVNRKISNSLPKYVTDSELRVEDLENLYNHSIKTDAISDDNGIQYEQENPHENNGGPEIKSNIERTESVTARFFGSNGLTFHSAQIWSNLVSYYVFHGSTASNSTVCPHSCGAIYCNADLEDCQLENSAEPSNDQMRYIFTGISIMLGMMAIFLVVFLLDPLHGAEKQPVKFSLRNLAATFNHCKKGIQICLMPISLYIGMIQGFYTADFTKSYIACALGNSHVGLVTVYYGLACALSSTLSGYLVKYTGRIFIFLLMQVANLAVNTILLMWTPDSTLSVIFYLTAGLLGLVTGILWSQIPAFYSILFKKDEEAAFASYYVFNSLGWLLPFVYSNYLCTSVKIYILIAVSSLGVIGFLVAERMYRTTKNKFDLTVS